MSLLEGIELDRGHVVLLNNEVDVDFADAAHILLVILVIMLFELDIDFHTLLKLFLLIFRHFLDLYFRVRVNCFLGVDAECFVLGEARGLVLRFDFEIGWCPGVHDVLFHVLDQLEPPDSNLVVR